MNDGARRWFRPTLWPSVFTGVAVVMLLQLGNWQLERLHWKRVLLQDIAAHMALPPAPFPDAIQNQGDWAYRPVTATGVFDHAHEIYLFAAGQNGGGAGYQVITPLKRDGGGVILVSRGWVPTGHKDPATRKAGQTPGRVTVTGLIRFSEKGNFFSPAHKPGENIWYVRDIPAMAGYLGLAPAAALIEADGSPNPGGWPKGGQTIIDIPNNHLDYALTWYGLALVLLVIYVVYHWRRG
jgi:surfeit locus 1 family protein